MNCTKIVFLSCVVISCTTMSGCNYMRRGELPIDCTGKQNILQAPSYSIKGPQLSSDLSAADVSPIEITAVARPHSASVIPLLYVFGPESEYVHPWHKYAIFLQHPAFEEARKEAYWAEAVGSNGYLNPELGKCELQSMLIQPLNLFAPVDGLLFVQFLAPNCVQCKEITAAIQKTVAQNPGTSFRWVRVTLPRKIGKLQIER